VLGEALSLSKHRATVVRQHQPGGQTVFGPAVKEPFHLHVSGELQGDRLHLEGHVVERPEMRIRIGLKREEPLP
jgi:hypothetical protein